MLFTRLEAVCALVLALVSGGCGGTTPQPSPPPPQQEEALRQESSAPRLADVPTASARAPEPRQPPGWTKLRPPGGGFEAEMPAAPREEKSTKATSVGPVDTVAFTSTPVVGTSYSIVYATYPVGKITSANREHVLDGARDGAVGAVSGRLVSERHIMIDSAPGREIVFKIASKGVTVRMRLTLLRNRLYIVQVVSLDGPPVSADEEVRFLESIHFVDAEPHH